MFSPSSLSGQPKSDTNGNNIKKALKVILVLVFVVMIVVLLTFAVILSGRTGINPMQTPSPAPTTSPTAAPISASSLIVVSVGLLQPYNPEMRFGFKVAKKRSG